MSLAPKKANVSLRLFYQPFRFKIVSCKLSTHPKNCPALVNTVSPKLTRNTKGYI